MLSSQVDEYRQALNDEPLVYQWLARRGLFHSAVEKFRLGYDGERLTIPYFDWYGRVVDVTRRSLNGGEPKYLRTANVPFMVRSANADEVVLCEGEIDTITCHMAGIKAMGIPGAKSWDPIWGYLLRDCTVTIAFDGDEEGRRATARVFKELKSIGVEVYATIMPDQEDINSLWVDGGKDALCRVLTSGKGGIRAK